MPSAIFLVALSLLAFGTWGTLRRWRSVVDLQLELDRRVGHEALILRAAMNRIEGANARLARARAALIALRLAGPFAAAEAEALRALMRVETLIQDATQAEWTLRQARWRELEAPLPAMGWRRPPEDPIGPRPLERDGRGRLPIRLARRPRRAGAEVFRVVEGKWDARWD